MTGTRVRACDNQIGVVGGWCGDHRVRACIDARTEYGCAGSRVAGGRRATGIRRRGVSSRLMHRPAWDGRVEYLREGVVLVVRALDRLAGSKRIAIEVIRDLGKRGLRLCSLTEPFLDVDASTPMGEAIIGIMAVLAQLRMSTIRENTRRGLAHARAEGRVGGRRPRVTGDRL